MTDRKAGRPERGGDGSITHRLVEVARESIVDLFCSHAEESCASMVVDDHIEVHELERATFSDWLRRVFYERFAKVPPAAAVRDALSALRGVARFAGTSRRVYRRVGQEGSRVYLDLANAAWEVVEVGREGWEILEVSPVPFVRSGGMGELPRPIGGTTLGELRLFLNVRDDSDFALVVSWVLNAMRPTGPYPVLVLQGGQGNAKSTVARVLRDLLDPNVAGLRSAPREQRDLMVAARNSWVLAFDNLSDLPSWLSDSLCRLASGGGFATRANFRDVEEVLIRAQRPIILNGIPELATRPDLLDRALVLELPRIADGRRLRESDFDAAFLEARPRILGALLDALVVGLRNEAQVEVDPLPRMADFALRSVAAESSFDLPAGTFLSAYQRNLRAGWEAAIEASLIGPALLALATKGPWRGSARELLDGLDMGGSAGTQHGWPRTSVQLSNEIRRLAPSLERLGVQVSRSREVVNGERAIAIRRSDDATEPVGQPSGGARQTDDAPRFPPADLFASTEDPDAAEGDGEPR